MAPATVPSAEKRAAPWWQRTTVYQIYPRSFADSNGDGIGDLPGVIERLDYLRELGVETLWLSPFWRSPQADFGYDCSDHYAIAPEYGTQDDLRALIEAVHARGMKLVVDMVLNHTSIEHPWFVESRASRENDKRDWYLWRDGQKPGGRAPPNNWRSMLGGSGWHWDAHSGQWFFASFLPFQPDLNWRNPAVKAAMLDVVRHWLGLGVDGLRLDIFNALFKDASFRDNPFSLKPAPTEDDPNGYFQRHVHTLDHPDTLAFARELRAVVDGFDPPRFLVGEVFGGAETLRGYCARAADRAADRAEGGAALTPDGLHLVFLFQTLRARCSARAVRALVDELERSFAPPLTPTWVLGNHDRPRSIDRLDASPEKAKLLAALQLTVRGVPFVYYGEEIGMEGHELPLDAALDPVAARFSWVPSFLVPAFRARGILLNRDECRAPMQWHAGENAGFTDRDSTPWLPVHPRASSANVAAQTDDPGSLLSCYRALLALRRAHPALQEGSFAWLEEALPDDVVAYRRAHEGARVEVFLNFGDRAAKLRLPAARGRRLWSTRGGALVAAPSTYVLGAFEGVMIV
jgi:oligo-1,6-glucosidase/alpha-glucosidase